LYASKGKIIGLGVSGLVELSEEGYAVKSPWPPGSEDSLSDMRFEAKVYNHLGSHPRLIKVIDWDAEECCLTMENMSNGNLKDYLEKNNACISEPQRRRWILQAVEGLAYLHTKGVIHYDFKPKNILLDENLEAKIADFGCSAFNGSKPTGGAGVRYAPPKGGNISSGVQLDIFALGSTIYAILTGKDPFAGVDSEELGDRFWRCDYPDILEDVEMDKIVRNCWKGAYPSVEEVKRDVDGLSQRIASITLL